MSQVINFKSRYEGLMPYPNRATVCTGDCEGMGCYPLKLDMEDITDAERAAWNEAHSKPNAHNDDGGVCDGWHFIICATCKGTGLRS